MKNIHIQIEVSKELYTKNPDSSELGRKIISSSIELINEIGFESFTFKKLGATINSPESSIYRYFTNKQALLIYLTSWYWTWTEYRLVFAMTIVASIDERLNKCIEILTQPVEVDDDISYVNEILLSEIIFAESLKAYHTKNVDEQNKIGCFEAYKSVVQRVSDIVLEIQPDFEYPHMLISTIIEGAHQQKYFSEHLPALTDKVKDKKAINSFYTELTWNFLKSTTRN
ncbi:MAG: TetR/AcrR family transcriptional regulator [Fluviicola sp.]|nr:TetR/AcrR family transcriptional regulator [Fluviicola sp.]PHQ99922.1 MAG: TetR family transcriptional regulator [Marinosulfonomonas sp.]